MSLKMSSLEIRKIYLKNTVTLNSIKLPMVAILKLQGNAPSKCSPLLMERGHLTTKF